jgi:hypothetical protein
MSSTLPPAAAAVALVKVDPIVRQPGPLVKV